MSGPGAACGWGTRVGDSRNDVEWNIRIDASTILLDEDMPNWPNDDVPYSGTLRGRQFDGSLFMGDDYLRWACQFKGGTLTGEFNTDFSTFAATEILTWGPPERETTVTRRWVGRLAVPRNSS
jgi:hypothetical protein